MAFGPESGGQHSAGIGWSISAVYPAINARYNTCKDAGCMGYTKLEVKPIFYYGYMIDPAFQLEHRID